MAQSEYGAVAIVCNWRQQAYHQQRHGLQFQHDCNAACVLYFDHWLERDSCTVYAHQKTALEICSWLWDS